MRRALTLCSVAVAAAILAAYSNHFQNGFHFDDSHAVTNNASIRSIWNIPRFFRDATTFSALPSNQSYRPVVTASLAVDYRLGGGLRPFWFQASDFAWFLIQTALIGWLVRRLLDARASEPRHALLAVLAAGLYGLHPANTDTVNYIIARSDILSTVAVVAGLVLYICLPRWRPAGLYLLPVVAGMLAKPITAMFAPLLAAYVLLFPEVEGGRTRRLPDYLVEIAPAFLVCGALSLFVWDMTPRTWVGGAADARRYLLTQPYVALLYFKTFFWPTGLSADYDLAAFTSLRDPRPWAGFAFVLVLVAGAAVAAVCRRSRVVGFGLLWFIVALLPTSLAPLAEVMNDHRTFFPYIGLVIALAGVADIIAEWMQDCPPAAKRLAAAGAVLLLGSSGFATYQRNKVWRDDESLWRDAALKGPGNGRALMNYGDALMAKGRLAEALAEFQKARVLAPFYPVLYVNLGVVEGAMGNNAQAERDFRTALELGPQIPDCHTYYARWLLAQGRWADAEPLVRRALDLSPADLDAQRLLAQLEAAPAPSSADSYIELSLVRYRAGRYMEAIGAAEQALKLNPGSAEAYNNIGAAWNSLGNYSLGAAACAHALKLRPGFVLARNNLTYALQMAGQPLKAATPRLTPSPSPKGAHQASPG